MSIQILLQTFWLRKKCFLPLLMMTRLQTKKALYILMQHNVVDYDLHKRGFVEYRLNTENVLTRLRFPRYIYSAKMLYGDTAELLVEELLRHGQIEMSRLLDKVTERLDEMAEGLFNCVGLRTAFMCIGSSGGSRGGVAGVATHPLIFKNKNRSPTVNMAVVIYLVVTSYMSTSLPLSEGPFLHCPLEDEHVVCNG